MLEQQCKYALELLNLLNKQKLTDRRRQLQVTFLNLHLVICPYSTYVQYCTVMYCTHVQKTVESQVTLFTFGQLSVQYMFTVQYCTVHMYRRQSQVTFLDLHLVSCQLNLDLFGNLTQDSGLVLPRN